MAYCRLRNKALQIWKGTPTNNSEFKKHTQRVSSIPSSRASMFQSFKKALSDSVKMKIAELLLTIGITHQYLVFVVDDLNKIIKCNRVVSTLDNLKLHRTKGSNLTTQVISLLLRRNTSACLLISQQTFQMSKVLCLHKILLGGKC